MEALEAGKLVLRVLACIATEHDRWLVLLAALVCAATTFAAFHAYAYAASEAGARRSAWVFLTSLCAGAGIWATHFVAMLAYQPTSAAGYDAVLTIVSLLIAAAASAAGFLVALRGGRAMAAAGGAIIGAGIAAMHFVGMRALVVAGTLGWDRDLVAASVALGVLIGAAAMLAWRELAPRRAMWAAPMLLALAILAMHFTAVGALTVPPDPALSTRGSAIASATLAASVTAVTALVLLALLATMLITSEGKRDALSRNQELLDAALEGLVAARDGRIVNVNHRLLKLTRRAPGELLGKSVIGDVLMDDGVGACAAHQRTRCRLKTATGIPVPVEVVRRPLTSSTLANEIYAIRDLTDLNRVEEELRQQNRVLRAREEELRLQNRRFELALSHMPVGMCMVDGERRLAVCSKRYSEMYAMPDELAKPGASVDAIVGHRRASGLYAGPNAEQYWRERLGITVEASTTTNPMSDGRVIQITRRPIDEGGWIDIHEDVTERQRLSDRLEAQNQLLQQREAELKSQNAQLDRALERLEEQKGNLDLALANMSQGLAMFDAEERLVVANDRYAKLYGLEPAHLRPGVTLRDLIEHRIAAGVYPGLTADDILERMRRVLAHKREKSFVSRLGDGRVLAVSIHPRTDGGWVVTLQDITEREQLHARLMAQNALLQQREEQLAAQNARFDTAISNMSQGMCLYDAEQRIVFANRRFAEIYGLGPEQVKPGTTLRQVFEARVANGTYSGGDAEKFIASGIERFDTCTTEVLQLPDGRFISVVRRTMPGGGLLSTHEDITEREKLRARLEQQNEQLRAQEETLRSQNLRLDAALNNMLQGLAIYDRDFRLVMCNRRYAEMYGLSPAQVVPGTSLRTIIEHRIARGEFHGKTADELVRERMERVAGQRTAHYVNELSDGRHIAVFTRPMPDGGTVTTHHDITEQRRSEAKIAHMALHDTLTGLPNRVLLNERLEDALRRVKRGEIVATHLLDLDQFKTVNDTLGHPAGDKLLMLVADRLRSVVRDTDTIARMGGDEFAIVQTAITQPAEATALAHRIIEVVKAPYAIDSHQVLIGTSVGIAVGPLDGTTPDQLIRNADLALYRAKGDGRGTYRFFEREMDAQMQARRALENDLRQALANGEFELHYQPVVSLANNEVSGFEALVRWRHPQRGLVPPGAFIPLAEEIGLIVAIGEWAMREACATAAKWPVDLRIAVNLSPVQFRTPGLVQVVVSALAASRLAADRLELEITENALLQDSEETLTTLYQLRALGVRIAMDDFGTGYSSLSYLQSFPFDKLKIDRSFVKDITDGVGSLNIVRAVVAMARGLGMTTTAEGVETQAQLDAVRAEGCTEMQGFLYSQPMRTDEVNAFVQQLAAARGEDEPDAGHKSVVGAA